MTSPAISVVLVATENYALIRAAVRNLTRQHEVAIEMLIVAPAALARSLTSADRADLDSFAAWRHVVVPKTTHFDEARATGVRAATAPIVAFTEDHSFPQRGWGAALLSAFEQGFSVVGPIVENGNPQSSTSWANFLLEYGSWMPPGESGAITHLPGHNSAYRRDVLLALGERLTSMIEAESVLHWELTQAGHRLAQAPRARTRHVNFSRLRPSLALRYHLGRQFAARRASSWSWISRLGYAAAFPVIAAVRVARVARLPATEEDRRDVLKTLPLVGALVLVASIGESIGYLTRQPGASALYLSDIEHDRRRFTRDDESLHPELG
jgi:hypothetical protein